MAAPHRVIEVDHPASGLRAVIVLDSVALGPACGGTRTWRYPSWDEVVADARRLARGMTVKCAVAGLDAGGAKAVVWDRGSWDRAAGFERLGEVVEDLGGLFRTAGDLGTGQEDLDRMALRSPRFVKTGATDLAAAVGRGLASCVDACLVRRGRGWSGLVVAVQGAGLIGAACGRALAARGAEVVVADVDRARAEALAAEVGGRVAEPSAILEAEVDVLVPCAIGGVVTEEAVRRLRAWALCGAANGIVADAAAAGALVSSGILHVPDAVSSAGAVVDAIARDLMTGADPTGLVDRLGTIAGEILDESARRCVPADEIARERAMARIDRAS